MNEHNYCVILAGGQGTRFWPVSRQRKPKQFIDFFGMGRTLLQQTYDRMARFIAPDQIYVITQKEYIPLTHEQLAELPEDHILEEPMRRNTAPAASWAALNIRLRDRKARIVYVPADQLITGELQFQNDVLKALDFVDEAKAPVALGITPNRPDTSYGYIQKSETKKGDFYRVKSFSEKPELDFAKFFVECGEFCWNTGIFLRTVKHLEDAVVKSQLQAVMKPEEAQKLRQSTLEEVVERMKQIYVMVPNLTLDSAVLEKTEEVYVLECKFGWADIGNWDSFYQLSPKDANENVVPHDNLMCYNAKRNVVSVPQDKQVVLEGLNDYVLLDDGNLLVVCPRDKAPYWRKYVNDAQINLGDAYL